MEPEDKHWIFYFGFIGIAASFVVAFASNFTGWCILIGILISLCIIGIGEIITTMKKMVDNKAAPIQPSEPLPPEDAQPDEPGPSGPSGSQS